MFITKGKKLVCKLAMFLKPHFCLLTIKSSAFTFQVKITFTLIPSPRSITSKTFLRQLILWNYTTPCVKHLRVSCFARTVHRSVDPTELIFNFLNTRCQLNELRVFISNTCKRLCADVVTDTALT